MADGNITIQVEATGADNVKAQLAEIQAAVSGVESGMQSVAENTDNATASMQGTSSATGDAKTQMDAAAASAAQTAQNVQSVKSAAEGAASAASKMAASMSAAKSSSAGAGVSGVSGGVSAAAGAAAGGFGGVVDKLGASVNRVIGPFTRLIGIFTRLAGVVGLVIAAVGAVIKYIESRKVGAFEREKDARRDADHVRIDAEERRQIDEKYEGQIAAANTAEELAAIKKSFEARQLALKNQLALMPAREFMSDDQERQWRMLNYELDGFSRWLSAIFFKSRQVVSTADSYRELGVAESLDDTSRAETSGQVKSILDALQREQRSLQREKEYGVYVGTEKEFNKDMNAIARKIAAASDRLAQLKEKEVKDALKSGEAARAVQDKTAAYEEATLAQRRKMLEEARKELEEAREKAVKENDPESVQQIERALTELHGKEIALSRDEDRDGNKTLSWSVGESTNRYARIGLMRGAPNITGIEQTAKNTQRIAEDVSAIKEKVNEGDASDSVAVFSA